MRYIVDIAILTDDQELAELLLSFGFLIFTIMNYKKTNKLK